MLSYKSYIFIKIVRILLLRNVISQDVTKKNFNLIAELGSYKGIYADKQLHKLWNISVDELNYINLRINNIKGG